jgi:geranylgeranyl diphosphate synthase type II
MKMNERRRFDLASYMEQRRRQVDEALDRFLPAEDAYPQSLHTAMRYSVFSGGKRFRPILTMASFEASGGEGRLILPVACSVELIHTYSLIHDDLPCMDDDDLRRGKPTNHKVFGEAVAVLAGDALLTYAFELIVTESVRQLGAERTLAIMADLTRAIGTDGMVAGQVVDMESESVKADEATVEYIHSRKTGALLEGCVRIGAIGAGAEEGLKHKLSDYGRKIGLAFQIVDDCLDAEGKFGDLKSGAGRDEQRQKATYPAVFGLERSRHISRELAAEAKESVADIGAGALPLISLAELVVNRTS